MAPDKHFGLQDDRLDLWLDQALRQYSDAEPRAGLESRILANLQMAQPVRIFAPWWRAIAISTLAACLLVSIWIGMNRRRQTPVARHPELSAVSTASAKQPVLSPKPARTGSHHSASHVLPQPEFAKQPRLAQFPSPHPLTAQEQLLARYVRDFPQEARVVASEQTEAEAKKQLEELTMERSLNINSDQRER